MYVSTAWRSSPSTRVGRSALVGCALVACILLAGTPARALPAAAEAEAPWSTELRVLTPTYDIDGRGIAVPGYARNEIPGAPSLPVWSTLIELPANGAIVMEYNSSGSGLLVRQVSIPAAPVPYPEAIDRSTAVNLGDYPAVAPTIDRPDPAIYEADAFYPASPVILGEEQWQRGQRLLAIHVFPFQFNPTTDSIIYHPDVRITVSVAAADPPVARGAAAVSASSRNMAASTAGALRLRTDALGLYRLTYNDLLAAGVPLESTDVTTFAMSHLGQPVAIEVTGNGNSAFEPDELVVFYAQPYEGRYQTSNVYWFTYGGAPGLRMATRSVTPTGGEPLVTSISQTVRIERNLVYESTFPRPQDADHWFDQRMSPDIATGAPTVTRNYSLTLDDPLYTGTARIQAALHGGADRPFNPDKSVAIYLNGNLATTHRWEGMTYTTVDQSVPAAWLSAASPQVSLVAATSQLPGIDFYSIAPDWVSITYPALADAEGDRIYIESVVSGANQVAISGFTTPAVQVYDLRQPTQPVRVLSTAAQAAGATYTLSFWDADLPAPSYFLSSYAALAAPLAIEPDNSSSWRTANHVADYIAIVHRSLWSAIDPLLARRAGEGLRIAKVDVQDIYDEWSYGRRDPEAIRDFLRYAYYCWNGAVCPTNPGVQPPAAPTYVLLVGDGQYDFIGASSTTFPNLIPPYLAHVDLWQGETSADNRYVAVDGPGDYLPDMALGRLPATNSTEVSAIVDKIIAYESTAPAGDWQNRVIFVADNNLDPAGNFHALSDDIRVNWLPPSYDDRTIYFNRDYTSGSLMREAIKNSYNAGALMIQWFGHGNVVRWGSVEVFRTPDIASLQTNDTWPITVAYTCLNGYYIYAANPHHQAMAEVLVNTGLRGSVAALAPSGYHVGDSLQVFNRGVVSAFFQQRIERVGLAVDAARQYYAANSIGFREVVDTYTLFGDPALKLRLPAPLLAGSTLDASRDWAPPGRPITFTAILNGVAPVSTTTQLTLTLPAELGDPTALSATSSNALYDPVSRQVTWNGVVTTGTTEVVSFSSAFVPDVAACSQATVAGQARDGLAAATALAVTVQAVTPDVDCDGAVDVADVQQVAARWGASLGNPPFDPRYDLDGDDRIGVLDLVIVAGHWQ